MNHKMISNIYLLLKKHRVKNAIQAVSNWITLQNLTHIVSPIISIIEKHRRF